MMARTRFDTEEMLSSPAERTNATSPKCAVPGSAPPPWSCAGGLLACAMAHRG